MPSTNRASKMQAELTVDAMKVAPAVAGSIVSVMGIPASDAAALATLVYVLMLSVHHAVAKWLWPAYRHWQACRLVKKRRK